MEPLMSSSSSREKDDYNPRQSSDSTEFNVIIHAKARNTRAKILILVASIAWLSVFALLLGIYHRLANNQKCNCEINDVGSNLLVGEDVPIINKVARKYHYLEDKLDDDDFSVTDPVWADLFPVGGGIVYLSQEYIESRRLPISTISPNRPGNKSVYEIAGYHSLHCVSALRANLWRAKGALEGGLPYDMEEYWYHTVHCLADLRQYIMCNFDETLMRVEDLIHHPGQEQLKLCKDTGPIDRWLETNYQ
ncbi:hypothetical protein WAI453_010309 [Rhynchosporium graminicola]